MTVCTTELYCPTETGFGVNTDISILNAAGGITSGREKALKVVF